MGLETAHVSNRTCTRTPCYDLHSWIDPCYDNSNKKWPKMVTAVYLSTTSSKTTVVSNLKKAYSSEGVPTLNVASKVECPKSLCSMLQSHIVKKQNCRLLSFHQKLFISVYRCSGFALATILGCAVLFVTVLTLGALSSVSEQAVKRAKNHVCFLDFVGL